MITAKLRPYQVPHATAALQILQKRHAILDASDTGVGKTYSTLAVCQALGIVPLVIAPKALLPSWERVAAYLGTDVMTAGYEAARGSRNRKNARTREDREGRVKKLAESEIGIEKAWGSGSFYQFKHAFHTVVFDEVHNCQGLTTLNGKMLIAAKRQCENVITLSATAADSPLQMKALGFALGLHSLKDFQNWILSNGCKPYWAGGWRFLGDSDDAGEAAEGRECLQRLHSQIFPSRGVRLRKSEIPGFPKTQISTRFLKGGPEVQKLVKDINDESKKDSFDASWVSLVQKLESMMVADAIDMARDLVRDSHVVFFVNYRASAEAIKKALGDECGIIWGEQDPAERQSYVDQFQGNDLPYLAATYGAGGTGLGFHDPLGRGERSTLMFPTFGARSLQQAFGRVPRDGGAFSQQFLLGFAGTLHEETLETVQGKLERMEILNDGDLQVA